jgi:hypothetical protein
MQFVKLSGAEVISSTGISVKLSRHRITVKDAGDAIGMEVDPGIGTTPMVVYAYTMQRYPPHADEPVLPHQRGVVIEAVREGLRALGIDAEIEEQPRTEQEPDPR